MSPIQPIKKLLILILLTALLSPATAFPDEHKVLILHSYNSGFPWTDNVMAGMNTVFDRMAAQVSLHVEYMDTKWFPPAKSFDALEAFYRQKFKDTAFDVILLSDNNALTFALSRRETLFPGVPIVFCGINDFNIRMLGDQPGLTGIAEEIDITGTISLARTLFPEMRRFFIINDQTPTARANQQKITRAIALLKGSGLTFTQLENPTAEELSRTLAALPDNTGVLLFTFHQDAAGQWLSTEEFLTLVRTRSRAPVFSFWDHYIGHGVLGGKVIYGREQGKLCAEYATKILSGQKASSLPIIVKSPNIDLIDFRLLRRFKVPADRIPDDALVTHRPEPVMKKYRTTILLSVGAAALLLTIVILLAVNAAVRRKTMATLRASETRYRNFVDATQDLVWAVDTRGKLTYINKAVAPMLGYSGPDILGREACSYLEKTSRQAARELLRHGVEKQAGWTGKALSWIHQNGEVRVLESTAHPLFDTQGNLTGFSGIDRDITRRRKTEERLKASKEKYRRIFENSVVGFFQSTPQGRFINVNPAFARMLKYDSPRELLTTVTDITRQYYVDPEDRVRYRYILRETGQVDGLEFRVQCRDGSQIWVSNSTRAYFDDEGRVTHYEGVIADITKRKLAEEALEKRIVALTRPVDSGSAPISFEELFNLEDIQKLQDELALAMGVGSIILDPAGLPITRPSNFTRLCGEVFGDDGTGTATCLKAEAGAAFPRSERHVIRTCRISGLWNAEADIRIQGTHIASWLIGQVRDPEVSEEEIRARAREASADKSEFLAAFLETPAMPKARFEHLARTLHTLAIRLSNTAFQNLQQARLITALQRSEKEQGKLQAQLIQAQKMESVGRLAGGVAHDFNNMLSIISGNTELMLNDLEPDHPFGEGLREIEKATRRSTDLTRQLLAFARKQAISPRAVDLNRTLEGMLNMLSRLIGEDIRLIWHPTPGLWTVLMDPSQVDQILANLCVNARDAIQGVGTVTIETRNHTVDHSPENGPAGPGEFVQMTVRDTGAGMDPHTMDNLFEPFFTTKDVGEGTGLGLATVYGIVKQNKGFIDVESEPGRGSSFQIYLPRYIADPAMAEDAARTVPAIGGRETILLVEDEAAILNITTRLLEHLGYRVLPAPSPRRALEISRRPGQGRIHLLLTDVIMPDMNGRDLAGRLKQVNPDLKCLFMSGYTKDVIAHHGVLDHGLNFIAKPFTREEMAAKLREILDPPDREDQGT